MPDSDGQCSRLHVPRNWIFATCDMLRTLRAFVLYMSVTPTLPKHFCILGDILRN